MAILASWTPMWNSEMYYFGVTTHPLSPGHTIIFSSRSHVKILEVNHAKNRKTEMQSVEFAALLLFQNRMRTSWMHNPVPDVASKFPFLQLLLYIFCRYTIKILVNAGKGSICMSITKMKFLLDWDHWMYRWNVIGNVNISSFPMSWFVISLFKGTLDKMTSTKQGCHLTGCYGLKANCVSAEIVLCSHGCLILALAAGWPLAQYDGDEYRREQA